MDPMSFPICSQCGFAHPTVEGKCPMAKETTSTGEVIDFTELYNSLKNILTSQIHNKKIKDVKKFFSKIILEIAKMSEEYKEI